MLRFLLILLQIYVVYHKENDDIKGSMQRAFSIPFMVAIQIDLCYTGRVQIGKSEFGGTRNDYEVEYR